MKIVITCEHGGNKIPKKYQKLFAQSENILHTHEGLDKGVLKLAKEFAKKYPNYFFFTEISRLLVDLNRSKHHPNLFSAFTRFLSLTERNLILEQFYNPYRAEVFRAIEREIKQGQTILHLSVHSFTPIFKGKERQVDVGLLYDPRRESEKSFCKCWKKIWVSRSSDYRVRFNSPYLGKADGFITYLRKHFSSVQYIGVELEVNQKFLICDTEYEKIKPLILDSFSHAVNTFNF